MQVEIGPKSELEPGDQKFVMVDDAEIAIINLDGDLHAIRNFCPHMEGPLARGYISTKKKDDKEVKYVSCPFHEWEFNLETGRALFNDTHKVRTYDVYVEDDTIYLDV